ncbi:hypothetical protein LZL87_005769 [Fusarium oxysporum]|nr:hypothetical protein LZL87_005769 [Fusarium oxysporum]
MEENHPSHPNYEVVPGTVYLVTQPAHNNNEQGDIILVPTPSDSLGDPLRCTVMTALGNWENSVYVDIQDALGTSINQLNIGTMFLSSSSWKKATSPESLNSFRSRFLKLKNLLWMPFSTMKKGKRICIPHSTLTNGSVYRVGQVLETNSFQLQYRPWVVLPGTWGQFVSQVYRPLQLAWFPAIVWSGLEYGACVSWITALGLIWLSPLIGGLFGALMAGPLNDKLVLFLTR